MYELKASDGKTYGPYDEQQLVELVAGGRMSERSLVRRQGWDEEWTPIIQMEDLAYIFQQETDNSPAIQRAPHQEMVPGEQLKKPGKVVAISIMTLVGGILATISCAVWAVSTLGLWIPWIYSLVLGIMAIVKGSKMLGSNPAPTVATAKSIAIMQIINIINCDVPNLVMGIITLVFLNDEEVKNWIRSQGVNI